MLFLRVHELFYLQKAFQQLVHGQINFPSPIWFFSLAETPEQIGKILSIIL